MWQLCPSPPCARGQASKAMPALSSLWDTMSWNSFPPIENSSESSCPECQSFLTLMLQCSLSYTRGGEWGVVMWGKAHLARASPPGSPSPFSHSSQTPPSSAPRHSLMQAYVIHCTDVSQLQTFVNSFMILPYPQTICVIISLIFYFYFLTLIRGCA